MAGTPSYGWKSFCGILLMIVGFLNIIDGLVAITQSNQVEGADQREQLPLTENVKTWGWIVLILGIIVILAGLRACSRARRGRGSSASWSRA